MESRWYSLATAKPYLIISLLVAFSVLKMVLDGDTVTGNIDMTWASEKSSTSINDNLTNYLDKAASESKKILLFWHPEDEQLRVKNDTNLSWWCGSCHVTWNLSKLNDINTAAVVFLYKFVNPEIMPPKTSRRAHQLYAWLTGESPAALIDRAGLDLSYADSVQFNLTISYRRDADVYWPYGSSGHPVENITETVKSKKRLAVAVVSNCLWTPGARFRKRYLDYISAHIELDTYGKCFETLLPKNVTKFLKMISKYKFFFSFENAYHCRDYITEKFHRNGFRARTVPVVWGPSRSDYEAVAHPKSFIHVEDFRSINDLIFYLKYLDKNDTAYGEYFKYFSLETPSHDGSHFLKRALGTCQLCRLVNGINVDDKFNSRHNGTDVRPLFTDTVSKRTVASLSKWILDDNAECFQDLTMDYKGKAIPKQKNKKHF